MLKPNRNREHYFRGWRVPPPICGCLGLGGIYSLNVRFGTKTWPHVRSWVWLLGQNTEWEGKCQSLSCVWLFVTSWIVAHQAPLSMEFSRLEYWSGLPSPSPWDPSDPGIKPSPLTSPALTSGFFTTNAIWDNFLGKYFLRALSCRSRPPGIHLQCKVWQITRWWVEES